MPRVWLLLLFPFLLSGAERIEFFATSVESNGTKMAAYGDVLVLYAEYSLSADEAHYDRESQILELSGHIVAMKGSEYFTLGEYARLDTRTHTRRFAPFFLLDRSNGVWMNAGAADSAHQRFEVKDGMVSGCDPDRTLWTLRFSSADYDRDSRWMNVYNARLLVHDIPVFYFPYFGYSLDQTRRSGLLMPTFGVSSIEGIYYEQPVYLVGSNAWDVELRPQIRTNRGEGLYGELRFVDSNVSSGSLLIGYFQEKESYIDRFDLANRRHYGLDFDYRNHAFLDRWFGMEEAGQSGLYADVTWMNDIDYINLASNDETQNATSNQILSRVNLFYNEEQVYYGAQFKYYLDLTKKSNADTIQNLPTLRYHRYLQTLLEEHLYYTIDSRMHHFFRQSGKKAMEATVNLPVTLRASLLHDFLTLAYQAQLSARYITFSGDPQSDLTYPQSEYQTGTFGRLYHQVQAMTQVGKHYEEFTHTIGFDATYTKAGVDISRGYYRDEETRCSETTDDPACDFYTLNEIEESLDLKLSQFIVDREGRQRLFHRVSQRFSFDPLKERLSELEHELSWQVTPALAFYSDAFYSYQRKVLSNMLSRVSYEDGGFEGGISEMYEDEVTAQGKSYTNYFNADVAYAPDSHYRYFGKYAFDMETKIKKFAEIGFEYTRRCWEFGLRYVENNRPILTENDASSIFDKYIYMTLKLQPIGGTEINYKLIDALDGGE